MERHARAEGDQSQDERSNSIVVAGAVMGAVLALFLIAVFIIVILTARKAPSPAFTGKVIDLPPTHKPPPPYSERAPAVPLGVHASQVAWLCQTRRADRRHEPTDGQRTPATRPGPPATRPGPPATRPGPPATRPGPPATRPGPPAARSPTQQLSRLQWVCHQSGTDRVYINHREHYV
ncbi:hypothetical protein VZT92_006113 [Zoarces viviparus]|uniref:Uncharacterized protein n=1 Tax=Zoarces viviparus TaxID=48416 RepID=A0AAW1FPB6_ZOAVI